MGYEENLASAKLKYEALAISQEMERAVIEHLETLGALENCYVHGSSSCTGKCPAGQHCVTTTTGNCVCVKD